MGLTKPDIGTSKPFSDEIGEDQPFTLDGIRVVTANSEQYGRGEMVLIRARGHETELGVWGAYLLAQAKSVEHGDLGRPYKMVRKMVPEFSKKLVKALVPCNDDGTDIPF